MTDHPGTLPQQLRELIDQHRAWALEQVAVERLRVERLQEALVTAERDRDEAEAERQCCQRELTECRARVTKLRADLSEAQRLLDRRVDQLGGEPA